MAIREFLDTHLQPLLERSNRRATRFAWLVLMLFVTAAIVFALFRFPAARIAVDAVAAKLAAFLLKQIQNRTSLMFLVPVMEWLPAVAIGFLVLVVTRLLARPFGALLLSRSPISEEFGTYTNLRIAEANKPNQQYPELVDYIRHCFFEVWNEKDAASSQGVPSVFSHDDGTVALVGKEPTAEVTAKVDFLIERGKGGGKTLLQQLTKRWLGLHVRRGFQTLMVWGLVLCILVSSLPRPVLRTLSQNVEAVVYFAPNGADPERNTPVFTDTALKQVNDVLGEDLTSDPEEFDEVAPVVDREGRDDVAPETDQSDLEAFFTGDDEDLGDFADVAPELNGTLKDIEEQSGVELDSFMFIPLDDQDKPDLENDLKDGEDLHKRVNEGEVDKTEAVSKIKQIRDDLRNAENLRRQAAKDEAEAKRLREEAAKNLKAASDAESAAAAADQDAKSLQATADDLQQEAAEAEREAEELDKTASADQLEVEAKALRDSAARQRAEATKKKSESESLEAEGKADLAKEKKDEADKLRTAADVKEREAKQKSDRANDLKNRIDRAASEEKMKADQKKADDKRTEAEQKKKQAQEIKRQAEERRKEAEKKRQEAEKQKKEAQKNKDNAQENADNGKKKKRDAWKLARKAGIAAAALAVHPVVGAVAVYLLLSGKDAGFGGGSGGGSGPDKGPSSNSDGGGPAGEGPAGEGPAGEGPAGEGPAGEGPAGEGPAGEGPAGEGPAGEGPAGKGPGGEGPAGEGPAGEGPGGEGPGGEGPAGEGPAGEGPAGEGPGEEGVETEISVPGFPSDGDDVSWTIRDDGSLVANSKGASSTDPVGTLPKEFARSNPSTVLFHAGDSPSNRYVIANTDKGLHKFSSTGTATAIKSVSMNELVNEGGTGLTSGGRALLEMLAESDAIQLVHTTTFDAPDASIVKAWFLFEKDKGVLHWLLEPSTIEKRQLTLVDDTLKAKLTGQSAPDEISDELSNALDFIATQSEKLPSSNLHRYIPHLRSKGGDQYRVLISKDGADSKRRNIVTYESDTKEVSLRASISDSAWREIQPSSKNDSFDSLAEKLFFGDPVDAALVLDQQPEGWYANDGHIIALDLNARDGISIVRQEANNAGEVVVKYLPPSGQVNRRWEQVDLKDIAKNHANRVKNASDAYKNHPSDPFKDPVKADVFDSWVFQGSTTLRKSYPAWGKDDKSEVLFLFDRD